MKRMKTTKILNQKFITIINLFHGYYDTNDNLLKYLESKENCSVLSDLYKEIIEYLNSKLGSNYKHTTNKTKKRA